MVFRPLRLGRGAGVTIAALAVGCVGKISDTAPGAEPEDLLRIGVPALIVPGRDDAHSVSAARYLEECLPKSDYWDVPVAGQTAETTPARLLQFLEKCG